MATQKEIERFFRSRNDPPVVGVSDAATLLGIDETVVRRWCRDSDVHRVGPNFVLAAEDVAELAAALDDEESPNSDEGQEDDDEGQEDDDEDVEDDEDAEDEEEHDG